MVREDIIQELNKLFEGYLKARGLDLVDFICRHEGRRLSLRILVDRPEGGVTLSACADLNRTLGDIIEEKGILEESYILEVSSPGLDRPLKNAKDFARCRDRNIRFFFNEPINGKWELEGRIDKVEGDSVCIDIGGGMLAVPLSKITAGKQKIE